MDMFAWESIILMTFMIDCLKGNQNMTFKLSLLRFAKGEKSV